MREAAARSDVAPAAAEGAAARRSVLREYFETVVICVIFVIFSRAFVFQQSKIPTGSMKDTLLEGDYIMVNRFLYADPAAPGAGALPVREPRRGDVVVFRWPGDMEQDYIKRVVGLPGERVQVRGHRAIIDGVPVEPEETDVPYLSEPRLRDLHDSAVLASWPRDPTDCTQHKLGPRESAFLHYTPLEPVETEDGLACRVPENAYFMMGDNRNRSSDSRIWGALPRALVKGKAWLIWYSYREDPDDHQRTDVRRLYSIVKKAILFPVRTNWKRLFTIIR